MYKKNDVVEYRITMQNRTKFRGVVKLENSERVWISPTHINNKKVHKKQANLTCIHSNLVTNVVK